MNTYLFVTGERAYMISTKLEQGVALYRLLKYFTKCEFDEETIKGHLRQIKDNKVPDNLQHFVKVAKPFDLDSAWIQFQTNFIMSLSQKPCKFAWIVNEDIGVKSELKINILAQKGDVRVEYIKEYFMMASNSILDERMNITVTVNKNKYSYNGYDAVLTFHVI